MTRSRHIFPEIPAVSYFSFGRIRVDGAKRRNLVRCCTKVPHGPRPYTDVLRRCANNAAIRGGYPKKSHLPLPTINRGGRGGEGENHVQREMFRMGFTGTPLIFPLDTSYAPKGKVRYGAERNSPLEVPTILRLSVLKDKDVVIPIEKSKKPIAVALTENLWIKLTVKHGPISGCSLHSRPNSDERRLRWAPDAVA